MDNPVRKVRKLNSGAKLIGAVWQKCLDAPRKYSKVILVGVACSGVEPGIKLDG